MNVPMERHNAPLRFRGPRRLPMALIACALAASPIALPPVAGAQTTGVAAVPLLIVFGQERSLDAGGSAPGLTHKQAATLEAIRSDPLVSELHVGRSAPAALAAVPVARALSIPVPGTAQEVLTFTGVDVVHNAEGMVSLSARDIANDTSVSLVVQGADVLGSIEHGDGTWRVAPLGGGLTAVHRYDTSGLHMDPPGWGWRQRLLAPEPRPMDDAGASVEEADSGDVIDLMVLYTPAAAALGNIDAFIQFALNNVNGAYWNSNIGFWLRLVHKAQVDYTEHASDMLQDLRRLTNRDGVMDEIHGLRDRYGADLVALFVAGPKPNRVCGLAWTPQFGRFPADDFQNRGFSVTGRSCEATNWRIFAHELGHNQGARHDPYNQRDDCPTGPDSCNGRGNFPYRYGSCNAAQGTRTIMGYASRQYGGTGWCGVSTARFSSPNVTWRGVPTGDAARRDNRRVLLETARRVANYRQSVVQPPPPLPPPPPEPPPPEPPPPEPDDHGDTPATATHVQANSSTAGRLGASSDKDYFRIVLPWSGGLQIRTTGGTDTVGTLFLGDSVVATDDDGGSGTNFRITVPDAQAGTWYVEVKGYSSATTGDYTLQVEFSEAPHLHATLPYVAPAGQGHPSLVRVLNDSAEPNTVQVTGYDDSGRRFGPESLSVPAHQAATLTSNVLESGGDTGGGTFAGLGDGEGWWRLELEGERAFRAGTYYRTADGSLADLSVPVAGEQDGSGEWRYDVGFFNPGINTAKVSLLRLANPNDRETRVTIAGRDDDGEEAPGGPVTVSLPAQGAATFTAQVLENGGDGLTGRLGDGEGKWRLTLTADREIAAMSLLHATRTSHLVNLSAIAEGRDGSTPHHRPASPRSDW